MLEFIEIYLKWSLIEIIWVRVVLKNMNNLKLYYYLFLKLIDVVYLRLIMFVDFTIIIITKKYIHKIFEN